MVTASQQKLIDEIGKLLDEEGRVEPVWLAGSLGRGQGDSFSDVDLLVLVEDGTLTEVSSALVARLSTVVRAVHVNKLFGGRVLNVVTADWQRFDLSFIQREDLARHNGALLRSLFNRSGQTPPVEPEMPYRPAPEQLLKLVQEFIRVLGLAVVVVGREEYAVALSGIEHLRRMTFDLMMEENRVAPGRRGGALHRNSLLDAEQRAQLESLPRWRSFSFPEHADLLRRSRWFGQVTSRKQRDDILKPICRCAFEFRQFGQAPLRVFK
jgi:predicted nucleotidyltransferase